MFLSFEFSANKFSSFGGSFCFSFFSRSLFVAGMLGKWVFDCFPTSLENGALELKVSLGSQYPFIFSLIFKLKKC